MCNKKVMADYKAETDGEKIRYSFFCDLSHGLVTTAEADADSAKNLMEAWEGNAKSHFNYCRICDKWVIDTMYNPDVLTCVKCTPIEENPRYCPKCGVKINQNGHFCHICGSKLLYGGQSDDKESKSD